MPLFFQPFVTDAVVTLRLGLIHTNESTNSLNICPIHCLFYVNICMLHYFKSFITLKLNKAWKKKKDLDSVVLLRSKQFYSASERSAVQRVSSGCWLWFVCFSAVNKWCWKFKTQRLSLIFWRTDLSLCIKSDQFSFRGDYIFDYIFKDCNFKIMKLIPRKDRRTKGLT